jgi:hypothetical protein
VHFTNRNAERIQFFLKALHPCCDVDLGLFHRSEVMERNHRMTFDSYL